VEDNYKYSHRQVRRVCALAWKLGWLLMTPSIKTSMILYVCSGSDLDICSELDTSGLEQGLVVEFCECCVTFSVRPVLIKINKDSNKNESLTIFSEVKVDVLHLLGGTFEDINMPSKSEVIGNFK
jgi:hypothetical protein